MYTIEVLPVAIEDVQGILDYIAADSPQAAQVVEAKLESAIRSLSEFPHRCPVAPESESWACEVRCLLVFRYRVFNLVRSTDRKVLVLRVLHGSRLPPPAPPSY